MSEQVLIVGASRGIGAYIADNVASEVINISRSATKGDFSASYQLDVLKDELPEIERLNHIVYCPGSINLKPIKSLKVDDFRTDFEINVVGAIRVVQHYLKNLTENASITFFSTVAVGTGMPFHTSVAAAKGAIEGLTKSLAAELAPKVRVNAIAPTITDTPLAARILRNEKSKEQIAERHPLKRYLEPRDVGEMVKFLISTSARNITGQILTIDAGIGSLKI